MAAGGVWVNSATGLMAGNQSVTPYVNGTIYGPNGTVWVPVGSVYNPNPTIKNTTTTTTTTGPRPSGGGGSPSGGGSSGGGVGPSPPPEKKFYEAEDTVKGPTKVSIIATGLRPYTLHDFYFNGTLSNAKVQSLSGPGTLRTFGVNTVGQSTVISDGSGKIDIEFYYDNGIPDTLNETEYTQLKAAESSIEGNKPLKLVSPDGLSKIEFVMPVDLNIGT